MFVRLLFVGACIGVALAAKNDRSLRRSKRVQRFSLDLSNLKLQLTKEGNKKIAAPMIGGSEQHIGFYLTNASVEDREFACLNCDGRLFSNWLLQHHEFTQQRNGTHTAAAEEDSGAAGKHPNSPQYKEWARKNAAKAAAGSGSFLQIGSPGSKKEQQVEVKDLQTSYVDASDVEMMVPRLTNLWESRRLVIGNTMNPLHEQMDFVDALTSLAHRSPALTGPDCAKEGIPYCDSLYSGQRTASGQELRSMLDSTFGVGFVKQHTLNPSWDVAEQRQHVQSLLWALKSNFSFYYQKCLKHEAGDDTCSMAKPSMLLGQIPCRPEDDKQTDDCVYAELRLCEDCGASGPRFFEYARFHGPLALFETKVNRHRVMGQCEEFSRAGHALLEAAGFKARYVLDFTDHVWIEVWLNNTWVHADPSEGVLDQPLMYEQGWGKQMTLIFAFTPTSIHHITHTYTADYEGTVARRGISEESLNMVLEEANSRLASELPKRGWGYQSSKAVNLREVALWRHFQSN